MNQDEFKIEAYGTVTPPPDPDDEPDEIQGWHDMEIADGYSDEDDEET